MIRAGRLKKPVLSINLFISVIYITCEQGVAPYAHIVRRPENADVRRENMKTIIGIIIGLTLITGCAPKQPDTDAVIRANGGYAALLDASESIYKQIDPAGNGIADTNSYPPIIAALKPQVVAIHAEAPPTLLIQTLGGFNHQGLLVVLDKNATDKPTIGHNWVRNELSPGVFEFREYNKANNH